MGKNELIFGRAGLREVDRRAVEEFGLPILVLMENAGRGVAEVAKKMLKGAGANGAVVLAGPGNNGGDGLVAARHLHNAGVEVTVLLLSERDAYKEAAGVQLGIVEAMKLPVEMVTEGHAEFRDWLVESGAEDIVIDAIFGTGLSRKVEGLAAEVIGAMNGAGRRIVAVDIPSGMDADTGEALGACINATETVSFCGLKKAFLTAAGRERAGRVTVADIGVPRELVQELAEQTGR
jgi:NAD(P)H-hydrate epimerase